MDYNGERALFDDGKICAFLYTDAGTSTGAPAGCLQASSSSCGNGAREHGEACDDGNDADGDGCSSACEVECGWLCAEVLNEDT